MIDCLVAERLDDSLCLMGREGYRHPGSRRCPPCKSVGWRLFHHQGYCPAIHCQGDDGDSILLTGIVFLNTRQHPATLGLWRPRQIFHRQQVVRQRPRCQKG